MESKMELNKKYLELKKLIEKKEKKLKKVNRVLGAKEYVKQKLEECNKPEEDTEHVHVNIHPCDKGTTATSNVISTSSQTRTEIENKSLKNPVLKTTKTQEFDYSNLDSQPCNPRILNSHSFDLSQSQISSHDRNKSNAQSHDHSESASKPYAENDMSQVVPINTCDVTKLDAVFQGKKSGDKILVGNSEESPILITDSQPQYSFASSCNSDESQNSRNGLKKRLSLKRKRNQYYHNDLNKGSSGTKVETIQKGEVTVKKLINRSVDSEIDGTLSAMQNINDQNMQKLQLEVTHEITEPKSQSDKGKCISQKINGIVGSSVQTLPDQNKSFDEETVLECTPKILSSDLNKAFVVCENETSHSQLSSLYSSQLSSQDVIGSSVEIVKPKRRGRPPKVRHRKNAMVKASIIPRKNDKINSAEIDNITHTCMSQEGNDISGSQELFEHTSQDSQKGSNKKELCPLDSEHDSVESYPDECSGREKSDGDKTPHNSEKENSELSTLMLIQESFVEKKEYSTRRKSSTGSPFMISSIFQFIIDESKRGKTLREFELPDKKFGQYLVKKMKENNSEASNDSQNSLFSQKIDNRTDNMVKKISKQDDELSTPSEKQFVDSLQLIAVEKNKVENIDVKVTKTEGLFSDLSCDSLKTDSQVLQDFTLPRVDESQYDQSKEDLGIFTSSQSLFTPTGKGKKVTVSGSLMDSQTDSMDSNMVEESQAESTRSQVTQSSLQFPDSERLVSICTSSHIFRKKDVSVLGCLTNRSLSVWKYKDKFSFVHKWEFQENHHPKNVHGFSLEGKSFFISTVKEEENLHGIYISYYANKRDNFMFKATDIQCPILQTCHVSNRVIGLGYNKGETIHVWKYVLHNNLKCLASSDQLESTDGCLQTLLPVNNLPAALTVWTDQGELCLWNHENKRLLLRIKPDCVTMETRLVGMAWEQGYFFIQLVYVSPDQNTSGAHVIMNPSTMKTSISSYYKSRMSKGYSSHCTVKDHIIVVDQDYNVFIWDRYSSELLSQTRQPHAHMVTILDRHLVTGGHQCLHLH